MIFGCGDVPVSTVNGGEPNVISYVFRVCTLSLWSASLKNTFLSFILQVRRFLGGGQQTRGQSLVGTSIYDITATTIVTVRFQPFAS